ncbi:SDR family oxidoreductase [Pseudomonas sp. F1_0610]|uniref:SDR family NAD(P)-dependent oxidoreductase n=1 Tax=Pseudomonas sp. F1_0610 TaxID=3114284 RepID=UPI0039C29C1E
MSKTYVVYGVSKGLGRAIIESVPLPQDIVFGVSRSEPKTLKRKFEWIQADLSAPQHAVTVVTQAVAQQPVDYVIYNVGIWEALAFSDEYSFAGSSVTEITTLINTNITSCILQLQALVNNLKLSANAKVILIGSTWGLDNHKGPEVAFSASKHALRGVVHALRETLRPLNIGISLLNLGYLATEFDLSHSPEDVIEQSQGQLIPLQDVLLAIRFILATSTASCVKEIDMPAMQDINV